MAQTTRLVSFGPISATTTFLMLFKRYIKSKYKQN